MRINQHNEESDYRLLEFFNNKHMLLVDYGEKNLWDDKENTQHNVMTRDQWMLSWPPRFFTETLVSPFSSFYTPIISND